MKKSRNRNLCYLLWSNSREFIKFCAHTHARTHAHTHAHTHTHTHTHARTHARTRTHAHAHTPQGNRNVCSKRTGCKADFKDVTEAAWWTETGIQKLHSACYKTLEPGQRKSADHETSCEGWHSKHSVPAEERNCVKVKVWEVDGGLMRDDLKIQPSWYF